MGNLATDATINPHYKYREQIDNNKIKQNNNKMARPKKLDYDSDDFIVEIIGIAMQGLTDAEIVDSLADKFGVSLSPEAFSSMKNGCYVNWTETENQRRSARFIKVLARGRRKITSIVRGAYLKGALGGKKIKSKTVLRR